MLQFSKLCMDPLQTLLVSHFIARSDRTMLIRILYRKGTSQSYSLALVIINDVEVNSVFLKLFVWIYRSHRHMNLGEHASRIEKAALSVSLLNCFREHHLSTLRPDHCRRKNDYRRLGG